MDNPGCHFAKREVPGERSRLVCRKDGGYCGDLRYEGKCPLGGEPMREEEGESTASWEQRCRKCQKPAPGCSVFDWEGRGWKSNIGRDGRYMWTCPECAGV